jgi:hypothetical protein
MTSMTSTLLVTGTYDDQGPARRTLSRMGNRWGDGPPPEDAYERHSRDLAVVTAAFARHLDVLPQRLASTYDCVVRAVSADELTLLAQGGHGRYDESYAVQPAAGGASPFLVGRGSFRGGASADVAFGRFQSEPVPTCFCDACDETGEDLVAALEHALTVTVGGFEEYGRTRDDHYEVGYEAEGVGSRSSSSRVAGPGEPWQRRWTAWTFR